MSGGDRSHRVNPSKGGPDAWSEVNWGAQMADFKQMQYHQSILWLALVELLVEKGIVTREEVRDFARELDRKVAIMPIPDGGEEEPEDSLPSKGREKKKK
jgi:hypothetical protein